MSQVTKRALEASLKNLLLQKPLSKITINDIAEDCGINRMTFYYHFRDIYDLIEWSCEEDKAFLATVYKYMLVGLMLDWIKGDMKADPKLIVDRLALVIHGNIREALERLRTDRLPSKTDV